MKKSLLFIITLLMFLPLSVFAKDKIKVYFFHGDGCPHCAEAEEKLIPELEKMKDVEVISLEVYYNEKNSKLLSEVVEKYNASSGIPFIVIGDAYTVGYNSGTNDIIEKITSKADDQRGLVKFIFRIK